MFMKYHIAAEKSSTKMLGTQLIQRFTQKDSSYNATITKIPVRPISEKRIEDRSLYQKWGLEDWDPPAVEEFKQSKLYLLRLCF